MQLHEYPRAIATQQLAVLTAEKFVRNHQEEVNRLTAKIDTEIAFNEVLKNDTQRKTVRKTMMDEQGYREAAECLQAAEDKLKEMTIDLQLLINQFSIAKMIERRAIAEIELRVAA
ncbi:MAG: hypothetical protein KME11_04730 [Timaviella obliquedivisa GSE-PSE-MK23-08B]|jgi:hypothetical protein|nr:hypothetical protein [Timaviella obliquedivisa GSE-PSE-MK23-08B]